MTKDKIRDRELNRHLDEKYGESLDTLGSPEALRLLHEQHIFKTERQSAIMDYFNVMKFEPWQDTLFGVIDTFQLTSEETGAMVKVWIDRQPT